MIEFSGEQIRSFEREPGAERLLRTEQGDNRK